jgi:hypothetical protein
MVESDEVIHVSVRNKDMAQPENRRRVESPQVSEIEEQRTTLPPETDVECGIAERGIDQMGLKGRFHVMILGRGVGAGKRSRHSGEGSALVGFRSASFVGYN